MLVFNAMKVDLSFPKTNQSHVSNLLLFDEHVANFVQQMSNVLWYVNGPFNMMSFGEREIKMACISFNKLQLV